MSEQTMGDKDEGSNMDPEKMRENERKKQALKPEERRGMGQEPSRGMGSD